MLKIHKGKIMQEIGFGRRNLYIEGHWEELGTYTGIESDNKEVPATGWVGGIFNSLLSKEEINILSLCMVIEWLGQQLDTTENSRMKYSGSDFKFTSQANHMAKLKVLIDAQQKDSVHIQRIYNRRRFTADGAQSAMGQIIEKPGNSPININRVGLWN